MRFRYKLGTGVIVAVAVAHTFVSAQVRMPTPAQRVRSAPIEVARLVNGRPIMSGPGAFAPLENASRGIAVFGIVQTHRGELVPNAGLVNVRELITGRVIATTPVNELAQFSFSGLPTGLYSAELVGAGGRVLASTPAFTASAGEVIQISQTIPALPMSGIARFADSATSSALSTAAGSGVLAVTRGVPVSPGS